MLKIAFASSEIAPYASTGGLADVCGSLPVALCELGAEVTQFMPMYRHVLEGHYPVEDTGIRLHVPVGFHRFGVDVWRLKTSKPPHIYFIRKDEFFDRSHLYNLPDRDYDDNFERFIFFQKAVVALIDHFGKPFDIVHCHDWQTGLIPLYLRHGLSGEGRLKKEKAVYTIHNLAFQGTFNGDIFSYTNLPFSTFSVDCLEFYGNVNSLKGGITSADLVTTVSENYAREIQTEEWGCGLHGVLASARHRLIGIPNGIDPKAWDPSEDRHIAATFNAHDLNGKLECKKDLIRRLKLNDAQLDQPLLGMVTRLTPQKGIELIDETIDRIFKSTKASMVVLGSGSTDMVEKLLNWQSRYPGRISIKTGFDSKLARRILAGSDILLMPSKFEPCGLNQLYAMRYGTVPLVHRVGGLADTVMNVDSVDSQGYGFVFDHFDADQYAKAVESALSLYRNTKAWKAIQARAMAVDYGWGKSGALYMDAYRSLVGKPAEAVQ